ncbi:MAG TPA: NAD-dependent epimerase/dehydratase family protein [Propionibacterium sp.]|jgi:UDP-glucose 4-epimerase|nr:NAD-dependent epimerase/dehydratase family protein [Propionibacterium sp.]
MRLLITGGAGFIGSNLALLARAAGHDVVVLDDLSTGYRDNVPAEVEFVEASLLDADALNQAVSGADSIIHLAALGSVPRSIADPMRSHDVNVNGTLGVLEAARANDVSHLVMASSSSVYGKNPALPKHEREWVRPMSPYAVTKLTGEQYVLAYQETFGIQSLAFRFFNVYGPRQRPGHAYAAVIPVFMDALLKGEPLPVNGTGEQSRDFTFVDTVCRVLLRAAENKTSHDEPVNLAFGTNTSLLTLIEKLRELTGIDPAVEHREPRRGDVPHSQADNASLRALFPDVEPVELTDGLAKTWEWLSEWQRVQ